MTKHKTFLARLFALTLLFTPTGGVVQAQRPVFYITPFGGYRLGSSIALDDASYSKIDIVDNPVTGLAIGMDVSGGVVELMWTHQDTEARAVPLAGSGAPPDTFDINTDQFHLNGLYFLPDYERVKPYAIGGLGITRFAPVGDVSSLTRFSWALGGGVHVPLVSRLGLRLEAKWNPALASSSGTVFCNTATGRCFVSASGELINQFDFTAGLTLRI